ncbi:hypothetical protein, partial [Corynebacterium coyleae]|uniref:hypothetical protein n=1 Tax=Corynebacterium coyleae TaxID=53374 RepID=UPI00254A396E
TRRRSLTPTTKHNGFTRPQNLTQPTPTALLMVQVVDAAPVVPMLLARTAETMLGAVAALTIIAVGYVRKYPTVVLPRRGDDPY